MDVTTLLAIARSGGLEAPVQLSSKKMGDILGISQQTAARRLKKLEERQLITREIGSRGQSIRITKKGQEQLGTIYRDLSKVFGKKEAFITVCGTIVTGMGEGEYYMKMPEYKRQFQEKLGFIPYPGTLNLKLTSDEDIITRQSMDKQPGILIEGFKREDRTFGSVKCFKAEVENIKGAVVIPARTHHASNTLEVIATEKIRDELALEEGDRICLRLKV